MAQQPFWAFTFSGTFLAPLPFFYYLLLQICSQQNKSPVPSSTESNPLPHRRAFISHKSANPPIFYRIKFQV
jgi:hypothetical protein